MAEVIAAMAGERQRSHMADTEAKVTFSGSENQAWKFVARTFTVRGSSEAKVDSAE